MKYALGPDDDPRALELRGHRGCNHAHFVLVLSHEQYIINVLHHDHVSSSMCTKTVAIR